MNQRQRQTAIKAMTCGLLFHAVSWTGCTGTATSPSAEQGTLTQSVASNWNGQATVAQVEPGHWSGGSRFLSVKCTITGDYLLVILYPPEGSGGALLSKKIKGTLNGMPLELAGMLLESAERMAEMRKSGTMEVISCDTPQFAGLVA